MTKKKKSAKNSFISSVLMLCLCFTMFVGTTFAWYNDSVTSGRNTIVSGSLELSIEYYDGEVGDTAFTEAKWKPVTSQTALFDDNAKFEPGAVQVAYIRIKNSGDLAFKYGVSINVDSEVVGKTKTNAEVKLSELLKFGKVAVTEPYTDRDTAITAVGAGSNLVNSTEVIATNSILRPTDDPIILALVIFMPSTVGNEANPDPDHKPSITFGLNALAAQATIESDSFSTDYDTSAPLNFTPVSTVTQLAAAIAAGGNVSLNNDITTPARIEVEKNTTIDGNGETIKVTNADNRVIDISDTTEPTVINLNNLDIDASDAKVDEAYPRGISFYGNTDVTLNANGTTITSPYYAINVAGGNTDVNINLQNASVAAGWAGINAWSKTDVDVKDSTISGTNDKTYNADGWNNFGTIVMNYENASTRTMGSVLNFENTTIEGIMTTGNRQVLLDLRDDGITVNFKNCTFISTGTPNSQFTDIMFLICMNETITFTNCKFIKNGVEVDVKDYIGYYAGNNDGSSVIKVDGVTLDNTLIPEINN